MPYIYKTAEIKPGCCALIGGCFKCNVDGRCTLDTLDDNDDDDDDNDQWYGNIAV